MIVSADSNSPNGESQAGSPVQFNAQLTNATDQTEAIVNWGDGSPEEMVEVGEDGAISAEHEYLESGNFAIELTVSTDEGGSGLCHYRCRRVGADSGRN